MFLIFFVLLLEYNSFYQVFVTLSTVMMSIAGVLLGMLVTGMSFSAIMSGLGIVALTGIVVKNGIVLIDTYNHYHREDGVDAITSMLLTVAQRIRPVLLTATVTALGVVPMACARQHFATLDGVLENRLEPVGWQVLDGLFTPLDDLVAGS